MKAQVRLKSISFFSLGVVACLLSKSLAAEVLVNEVIDTGYKYLDSTSPLNHYKLVNRSTMVAEGARTEGIISDSSFVKLRGGSHVQGQLRLEHGSQFEVSNSVVSNVDSGAVAIAMYVGESSKGEMVGSTVEGAGMAVSVNKGGDLSIANTDVKALRVTGLYPGWGVGIFGSTVKISAGSRVFGLANGIHFSLPSGNDLGDTTNFLTISDSHVESYEDSAIKVEGRFGVGVVSSIDVIDDSTIVGGDGNLLEVLNSSTAIIRVASSSLNGNLTADNTSTLNVTLQNNARLTGDIINSNTLAINSGALWEMQSDNSIKSLSLNGGRVSFGQGAFKYLQLSELSGNGVFDMRINLDHEEGDFLDIEGNATGSHALNVTNTGVEVVAPDMAALWLVHADSGDANFALLGDRVDLGVYSYELEQRATDSGNDWYIVGSGKTISPSTQSALALFNAAPNIWNSELSTLRSRISEVRGKSQGGGWIRSYGSRFNATTSDGVSYQRKQGGLSLGVDTPVPVGHGQLSLGLLAGYSNNDLNLDRGTTGTVESYYMGGYGTWTLDDGYYLDGVLKLNRFRNESKVAMSDGAKSKGDYESTGIGGSLEFGRHITLADGYFLEPSAQLSSVLVQGERYRLDNGMQASNDRTLSILGKVGTSAGRNIVLKDGGVLKPYLRVALAQEFSGKNQVKVNSTRFDNDLFGSRAELGAGVSVSLSERLQVHADFDYMKGKHVEQPWGANVGLKLTF